MQNQPEDLGTQGRKNTFKGKVEQIIGKVQSAVGKATGNVELETKGKAKQVGGTVQSTVGNVEQKVDQTLHPDKPEYSSDTETPRT